MYFNTTIKHLLIFHFFYILATKLFPNLINKIMEKSIKTLSLLNTITYVALLTMLVFLVLGSNLSNGVYTYIILGALFEMFWLPSLLIVACAPICYIILKVKSKISLNKIIVPILLCVLMIGYLLLLF